MTGYIYVLYCPLFPENVFKIGSTHDLSSRLSLIQTGLPEDAYIVFSLKFDNPRKAETDLLKLLVESKYKNEFVKMKLVDIIINIIKLKKLLDGDDDYCIFKCSQCDYKTKYNHNLTKHLKIHRVKQVKTALYKGGVTTLEIPLNTTI